MKAVPATAETRDPRPDARRGTSPDPARHHDPPRGEPAALGWGAAGLGRGVRAAGSPALAALTAHLSCRQHARAVLDSRPRLPPQRPLIPQTRSRVRDALLSRRLTQRTITDREASSLPASARLGQALPRRALGDTSGFGNRAAGGRPARPAKARAAASPQALRRSCGRPGTGRAPPALRHDAETPPAAGCAARLGPGLPEPGAPTTDAASEAQPLRAPGQQAGAGGR